MNSMPSFERSCTTTEQSALLCLCHMHTLLGSTQPVELARLINSMPSFERSQCHSNVQPLSSRFALFVSHAHIAGSTQHVLTHIDTHLHLVASTLSLGTCLRCSRPYAILAPCCLCLHLGQTRLLCLWTHVFIRSALAIQTNTPTLCFLTAHAFDSYLSDVYTPGNIKLVGNEWCEVTTTCAYLWIKPTLPLKGAPAREIGASNLSCFHCRLVDGFTLFILALPDIHLTLLPFKTSRNRVYDSICQISCQVAGWRGGDVWCIRETLRDRVVLQSCKHVVVARRPPPCG